MKILLTGGAGFIGSAVSRALLERGDELTIIDNFNDYYDVTLKEDRIIQLFEKYDFDIHRFDISEKDKLEKIFQNNSFDAVCHLAAQAGVRHSIKEPYVYEKSNALATLNLLEMARHYHVKDFIFASSSSVYGKNTKFPWSEDDRVDEPISLYAATKRYGELMCFSYHHLYNIRFRCLRFFSAYGPWGRPDMALFLFTKAILSGETINVYNFGKMERDFTYIDDIVRGVVKAIDTPLEYEIINLGNNKPIALEKYISLIEEKTGKKAIKKMLPIQPGDIEKSCADLTKAQKLLSWTPEVSIEEGITRFVEWYREYYKIF